MPALWSFPKMQRHEPGIDPIQGEFFNTEALESFADALVRESIQNSLDAARSREQVAIRFYFSGGAEALAPKAAAPYFTNLPPHLQAKDNGLAGLPPALAAATAPVPFLVIEDFGTTGLQGDVGQHDDVPGAKNDYYYFWRNVGRTGKGEADRGRWGLGKNVFPASSRINTFFGLTFREGDEVPKLMGQSVLKVHHVSPRDRHFPYGYFGDLLKDGFVMPVGDAKLVGQFCDDFRLLRADQLGLSIVIPHPDEEITAEQVIKSVIRHYFFPILDGSLRVTVAHPGGGTDLDAGNLLPAVDQMGGEFVKEFAKTLSPAQWALAQPADAIPVVQKQVKGEPKWSAERFPGRLLADLQAKLKSGDRVALRVPLRVRPKGKDEAESFFDLFFERNPEGDGGRPVFIREGIIISDVHAQRQNTIRALVVVEDKPLATMLGDAENPAHTEWQEKSPKFRGKYTYGPESLRFIRTSVQNVVHLLTASDQSVDDRLLKPIFSLPKPQEPEDTGPKVTNKGGAGPGPPPPPPPPAPPRPLVLDQIEGGFRLRIAPNATTLPDTVTVTAAYEVRRGNPFKHYQEADFEFDMEPIHLEIKSADVIECRRNRLVLDVRGEDFSAVATGFDRLRDLRIRYTSRDVESRDTTAAEPEAEEDAATAVAEPAGGMQ